MTDTHNNSLTWATEADFRLVERRCTEILPEIEWQNNVQYTDATTLAEAVALVKNGKDSGLNGALHIRPTTSCFTSWMDYAFFLTVCYNRTHNSQFYTILRNECCF